MNLFRRAVLRRGLGLGLAGFYVFAAYGQQPLEAGSRASDSQHVVPVLEYDFKQEHNHVSPPAYRSVKASGLPMALHHRLDSIWSGASKLTPMDTSASDFPMVGEVAYRLRRSAWSDPERMVEARLLDGTSYQALVTRKFGMGREFELSAGVQRSESVFSSEDLAMLQQNLAPLEVRSEIAPNTDAILALETRTSVLIQTGEDLKSEEYALKTGVGSELFEGLYGQVTAGTRVSKINGVGETSAFDLDAALIFSANVDTQYTLTFNRSTRPSLRTAGFVEADTLSLYGDYTLSDVWSAFFGAGQSWAKIGEGSRENLFSGEVAFTFSPSETISFSGGYIYRSGSLLKADANEVEEIIRFSANLQY